MKMSKALFTSSLVVAVCVAIGCKSAKAQGEDPNSLTPPIIAGGGAPAPGTGASVPPIVAGALSTGGAGCNVAAAAVPEITDTQIKLPVETVVQKDATSTLKRGACAVALPLTVPAGYKMVVEDVSLDTDISLAIGASADGSVEVFTAGTIGDTLDISAISRTRPKHVHQSLSMDPQLTTECGAAVNLRSNSSLVLKSGAGNSSAKLSAMKLTYHLEACP